VVGAARSYVRLLRSTDNGFSWDTVRRDIHPGTDRYVDDTYADGPFHFLVIDEQWNNLDVYFADYTALDTSYSIVRVRYDLDTVDTDTPTNTDIDVSGDVDEGIFDVSYNNNNAIVMYQKASQFYFKICTPRGVSISGETALATTPVVGWYALEVTDQGKAYLIFTHLTGGHFIIKFYTIDMLAVSAGAPTTVLDLGGSTIYPRDFSLAVDGYGSICAVWSETTVATEAIVIKYATSVDAGANWDVNALTQTAGHGDYVDAVSTNGAGRTSVIGSSSGGFMFTYVEDNASAVPKTYVRTLTTDDAGATYDLEAEAEIATNSTKATDSVVGAHFFRPPSAKLMDLSDPGLVRVAFQVGEGNSVTDGDSIPVNFGQEELWASAYPSTLASEASVYSVDTGSANALLVNLNILPGPNSNSDYYTLGLTGPLTQKYISMFNKMGTTIRLLKHEPTQTNFMSDRSSYGAPTESSAKAMFDPQSYSFPTPAITASGSDSWIERDVRKIFLPPTTHLARTFIVNDGGYLKRTVWECEFGGNAYEISQVVPRFLSGQLCYYEANAYVIGPSRDPFSRTVLPSET
jgi:hypothetical protein